MSTEISFVLVEFPLYSIAPVVYLFHLVGKAAFGGLLVIALMLAAKTWIVVAVVRWIRHKKRLLDARVKLTNELFNAARFVKYFSLTKRFEELIDAIRVQELAQVSNIRELQAVEWAILWRARTIIPCGVLAVHYWILHQELTASLAFVVVIGKLPVQTNPALVTQEQLAAC
jgi:hypothetical protein